MKIGSLIKDALILTVITLVLGLALSGAKVATQPLIDKATAESTMKAYSKVCPGYATSEDITKSVEGINSNFKAKLTSVLECKDANGNKIGYIVEGTGKGFGGDLNLVVGFDTNGKTIGVQYKNTPSETPGLGMKTTESKFLDTWANKTTDDVDKVDTISGATISSSAFKDIVSMACFYANIVANK